MWLAASMQMVTSAAVIALLACTTAADAVYSAFNQCPAACAGTPDSWTVYNKIKRLEACDQAMLLDFAIHNPLEDPSTTVKIRACTVPEGDATDSDAPTSSLFRRDAVNSTDLCVASANPTSVSIDVAMKGDGANYTFMTADAFALVSNYMGASCDLKQTFSYATGAIVGVFSGAAVDNGGTVPGMLAEAIALVNGTDGAPETMFMQRCVEEGSSQHIFGIAMDNQGNFSWVQEAVQAWSNGLCLNATSDFTSSTINDTTFYEYTHPAPTLPSLNGTSNGTVGTNSSSGTGTLTSRYADLLEESRNDLDKRSDCTTVTVASGDSCGSLATKCGITGAKFEDYNSGVSNLCSSLAVGERLCCSEGTLPDLTPKENANGTCYAYTVQSGDSCYSIAAANSLTQDKIEEYNDGTTWGWFGCEDLLAGLNICLSTGDPPMPNAVANALCGPTVPGTEQPTNGTALADLNPCPLNACCDIWGQCGITPQYCTNTTGPKGNPGTAPANDNGCISNCGTKITGNDDAPEQFISVGYYESWNFDRPCLTMQSASIDTTKYTHIHWAFATIADDFTVVINDTYAQWDNFKALTDVKRIVSFGGWGYSTDASTYDKLREAMNPTNRLTFARNIIKFLNDEDIDGVDIDWEYPGAPDIPGIPAGLATDGKYYFEFLGALRGLLGLDTTKTISFAAPASYWYLKQFPVKQMAGEADYVVYMTYDLHGQWDYGNEWSQDGCEGGNCLRSHVNLTETMYTLAMITKAGVPANKVTVGVSSYGRSFKMTEAGCTGDMCTYVGPDSAAAVGQCTDTAGYISNAEILDIYYGNDTKAGVQSWYDAETDSNYLVYSDTEWVAYMTDDVKASRQKRWQGLNFAGTVDWAVDLAAYSDDDGETSDDDCSDCDDQQPPDNPWTPCTDGPFDNFDDLSDATINSWPVHCRPQYMLEALGGLLSDVMTNYTDMMKDGYDSKFKVYAKAVAGSAGSQVHDFMMDSGNDYFTCNVMEISMCCSYCSGGDDQCRYCFDGSCYKNAKRDLLDEGMSPATPLLDGPYAQLEERGDYNPENNRKLITKWLNESEPCPPDYSKRGYGPDNPYEQSIYWHLQPDKEDAFWADLLNATGIPKNNIKFGRYTNSDSCSGQGRKEGDGDDCWNTGYEFGTPVPDGYDASDVTNPKDVVSSGLQNSANLPDQIKNMVLSMQGLAYPGDGYEVVDAVSLPIMMMAQGVESMSMVVQTADKIEEEERKALILAFLSAILFFVPIAGEIVGAVTELADIATIISIMGAAGNVAMDVYTIVDDPENAPLAIVDLIMAPLALADVAVIAKAANIKRGMSAEELEKLGTRVGERMGKVEKVTGVCIKQD